ncbi:LysR family transcriptional regulator [Pseudomonas sp. P5_152]|uniref:LysR family transcriptional regulator n=1 Tax=unclassified Pseudomonas TaxID=196821 RepID=UPI00131FDF5D|nr:MULTISPECIES: LysR family transcriptional regulator [unclassified Pseudomonas]MDX9665448.1 LysR family transcriptional regulator [Pseudomonas sp. P5_152]QHD03394.1 transcriptional regulator [Pseudomonas sp. S04]QHF35879.1 transcriptional regulator [Pseudomonas sp. S19]
MIRISNISRVDLNLLIIFQCLMTERSVTRTAAVLHVTQGAVSSSLKRLREQFHDELFLRTGTGMVPTPRALEIAPKVMEALTAVSAIVDRQPQFAAESSNRVFNIALSDDIESYLSPRLVNEAKARGLSVSFAFHQTNSSLWKNALADPAIDMVLCSEPKEVTSHYSSQVLFSSSYSCLYDGPRLNLQSPISRDEYLRHEHVRVSFDGRRGFVDDLLESEGIPRRVSASFTHFSGALATLVNSDVIATLPTFAALSYARIARLTVSPVPIFVPAFRVFMVWDVEHNDDPHNRWLRNFIIDTTQELQRGSLTPV